MTGPIASGLPACAFQRVGIASIHSTRHSPRQGEQAGPYEGVWTQTHGVERRDHYRTDFSGSPPGLGVLWPKGSRELTPRIQPLSQHPSPPSAVVEAPRSQIESLGPHKQLKSKRKTQDCEPQAWKSPPVTRIIRSTLSLATRRHVVWRGIQGERGTKWHLNKRMMCPCTSDFLLGNK